LVFIMIAAGIQALASTAEVAANRRDWMGKLDFTGLKFKILASIIAIASIELLETYMNIGSINKTDVLWKIVILLGLALAGVLLAWMDRLSAESS
ncbi:MAG TPA: YqhA family protein, partial [Stellaceae bacterium]|nr:YqhA family protein [Stellaceae bacterium]